MSARIGLSGQAILAPMTPSLRGERTPRINPLIHFGFSNDLTQTWVLDVRAGADALWDGMEGRARTAIRKAEAAGITGTVLTVDGGFTTR